MGKILITCFSFFFIVATNLKAATNVDSLLHEANTNKEDTVRVNTYIRLVKHYRSVNTDSALIMAEKAVEIAENADWDKGKFLSYYYMGNTYSIKGMHSNSLEYNLKALSAAEQLKNDVFINAAYNTIGIDYKNLMQYDKSLEYYGKSLNRAIAQGDERQQAFNYGNIAVVHKIQNDYDSSMYYNKKALEIWERLDDGKNIALITGNMGSLYLDLKEFDKAIEYTLRSNEYYQSIGHSEGVSRNYLVLGSTELEKSNYDKALKYLDKGLEIALQLNSFRLLVSFYETQAKVYEKKGNFEKAYEAIKKHNSFNDSIFNDETDKKVLEAEIKFDYEKKALADSLENLKEKEIYEKSIQISDEKLKREKQLKYVMYGGILILIIFLGFVFNRYKISQKQKSIIDKQKQDVTIQKEMVEEQHLLLEEKNKEIVDSINYAKRIQDVILPKVIDKEKLFSDHFIIFKPKDVVSGDFYWHQDYNGVSYFAVADCTGHGVPGALVSVMCYNALNRSIKEYQLKEPAEILDKTREIIVNELSQTDENINDGMDISLVALNKPSEVSKTSEGLLVSYAGANNPLWIIRENANEIEEVKADKQPVGHYKNEMPFTQHKVAINKDDIIYLFTDGYYDQFGGEKGKKMKVASMREILIQISNQPLSDQKSFLIDKMEEWKGSYEQVDDICIMGLKV